MILIQEAKSWWKSLKTTNSEDLDSDFKKDWWKTKVGRVWLMAESICKVSKLKLLQLVWKLTSKVLI